MHAPWPPPPPAALNPERVLILKPCCLGDVLLATPLARAVAEAFPDARLDWAVGRHSRPALDGNPHVTRLVEADGVMRGQLRLLSFLRLATRLRRGRYDLALVPDRSPVAGLLAAASGAPRRVGLGDGWRGRFYTKAVAAPLEPPRHEAEVYLDLARALGLPVREPTRLVYRPAAEARARAAALLAGHPHPGPWLCLHPGGGTNPGMRLPEKRWPADRFAAVAARLMREEGFGLVLLGARDDRDSVDGVRLGLERALGAPAAHEGLLDLSGRADLAAGAALIERSELYLGNDSGMAHLAGAVGCPTVVIFGPTRPERYGPLPGTGLAVAPPGGGSVDRLRSAVGSRAIEAVRVEAVWDAARAALRLGRHDHRSGEP